MLHASSQLGAARPAAVARAAAPPSPAVAAPAAPSTSGGSASDPLLLRALRGDAVERPPVWAMRQAGRCMKVYRDMCKTHKTFRERSENADLAVEVSLQPWRAWRPDGVILFSDILTPLPGLGIPFDIVEGKGPLIADPVRTMAQVDALTPLDPDGTCPFVGQALRALRSEVGGEAAVLGFVGAPFTLATYIVEGGSSKSFVHTKRMAFAQPEVLHALLGRLADAIADYVRYQADAGAQAVQIFDSWASHLSPQDFDAFSAPYIRRVIDSVRATHPTLPIILYISGSGGLLERMAACGPDVISLDQSVDLVEGIRRVNGGAGGAPAGGGARGSGRPFAIQGNLDPGVLFGDKATVERRVLETIRRARGEGVRHVMNLGHGVLPGTPEENVAHYFEVARTAHERGI